MEKVKTNVSLILLIALCTLYLGCASNSAFVDALPSKENNKTYSLGLSARGNFSDSTESITFKNTDLSFLPIDFIGVFPLTDKADILLKYTVPITISFGFKASFDTLQESKVFYSAIGINLGIDLISLFQDTIANSLYFDMKIPFYQTLRINNVISFSAIPTVMIRNDYRHFQFLAGGNLNCKIGRRFGTYIELSAFYNTRYKEPEYQTGLAFFLKRRAKEHLTTPATQNLLHSVP